MGYIHKRDRFKRDNMLFLYIVEIGKHVFGKGAFPPAGLVTAKIELNKMRPFHINKN